MFAFMPLFALWAGRRSSLAGYMWPLALALSFAALTRPIQLFAAVLSGDVPLGSLLSEGVSALVWLFTFSVPLALWSLPSMLSQPVRSCGWLEDPAGIHDYRWFDGRWWAVSVQDQGVTSSCGWALSGECGDHGGGYDEVVAGMAAYRPSESITPIEPGKHESSQGEAEKYDRLADAASMCGCEYQGRENNAREGSSRVAHEPVEHVTEHELLADRSSYHDCSEPEQDAGSHSESGMSDDLYLEESGDPDGEGPCGSSDEHAEG